MTLSMTNYELFRFDYGVAQSMKCQHWDAIWAGLFWLPNPAPCNYHCYVAAHESRKQAAGPPICWR